MSKVVCSRCFSACGLVQILAPVLGLRGRCACQPASFCTASQFARFALLVSLCVWQFALDDNDDDDDEDDDDDDDDDDEDNEDDDDDGDGDGDGDNV